MQTLSTDETTVRTRQEYKTRSTFGWLPGSTHWTRKLLLCFLVHGGGDKGRPDWTGTNCIDADAVADLLVGEGAGEGYDGAFGGCVARGY